MKLGKFIAYILVIFYDRRHRNLLKWKELFVMRVDFCTRKSFECWNAISHIVSLWSTLTMLSSEWNNFQLNYFRLFHPFFFFFLLIHSPDSILHSFIYLYLPASHKMIQTTESCELSSQLHPLCSGTCVNGKQWTQKLCILHHKRNAFE